MSFIWRNTRLYRLFLHAHNQNSIRMNWSGWKRRKNVILRKTLTLYLWWGLNSGPVSLKAKALTTELWRLMMKTGTNWLNRFYCTLYYSLQRNWLMKSEMLVNLDYWFQPEIEFIHQFWPHWCMSCIDGYLLTWIFFGMWGKWFSSKWWGPMMSP